MLQKPIDEMSLRHLFSEVSSAKVLQIEYWGPVTNHLGQIEPSPDCIVLDKRKEPYRFRKCEFKFIPRNADEFSRNGNFDVSIIWDLPKGIDREAFQEKLRTQNGCLELIVMTEISFFRNLPEYMKSDNTNYSLIQQMNKYLLANDSDVAFSAYLIAKAYPKMFNSKKLSDLLSDKFQRVKDMEPNGKANSISRFLQLNIPLIEHQYKNYYRWNNVYEPKVAIHSIERLLKEKFELNIPSDDWVELIV